MTEKTRTFEHTLEIDALPEDVWKALTDAQELVRWFPLEARVQPGTGGSVWISWGEGFAGDMRIAVWDPPRRLKVVREAATSPGSTPTEIAIDYFLEGEGGRTRLGVVHQANPPWDFSGSVRSLNDSLLRIATERFTGKTSVNVWLSAYGLEKEAVQSLERRWQGLLDDLFGRARPAPA